MFAPCHAPSSHPAQASASTLPLQQTQGPELIQALPCPQGAQWHYITPVQVYEVHYSSKEARWCLEQSGHQDYLVH